ncbi:uncharacterized protein VTP21DRAFT_10242 [Calcarisporiella thermophila]|uniref:uncharacterized protein n=1 Tax=Calcarisporiella thermophila TaxID=911321 RepID=UPI003743030F
MVAWSCYNCRHAGKAIRSLTNDGIIFSPECQPRLGYPIHNTGGSVGRARLMGREVRKMARSLLPTTGPSRKRYDRFVRRRLRHAIPVYDYRGSMVSGGEKLHINWKELKAVELCLEAFPSLKETTLLIRTDNTTALEYLNNLGGTRSPRLNEIAKKIWTICLERHILISGDQGEPSTVYRPPGIRQDRESLGITLSGPIRGQTHEPSPAFPLMAPGARSSSNGFPNAGLEQGSEPICQPFVGSDSTGLTQSVAGTGQADAGDPALTISSLVPPTSTAEHSEASQNSEESDPASHTPNEIPSQDQVVVFDSLAHIKKELHSQLAYP